MENRERFQWWWSTIHCLRALTEPSAAGTGTIIRTPPRVEGMAHKLDKSKDRRGEQQEPEPEPEDPPKPS